MSSVSRRRMLRALGTSAIVAALPELRELVPERPITVILKGRRTRLTALPGGRSGIAHAQYAYHQFQYQNPYAYYGHYQMWAQWNMMQYHAYMRQLAMQYAWTQAYMAAMANYMQQYARGYQLSEPFPMDSIRSLYSYAQGMNGNAVIGLNRAQSRVKITDKSVPLMSAIADISEDEGWTDDEMEMSSGPQGSSRPVTESVDGNTVSGYGYRTASGRAFVSKRQFRDEETGDSGSIVVFNTRTGKEQRLVPLYS